MSYMFRLSLGRHFFYQNACRLNQIAKIVKRKILTRSSVDLNSTWIEL